MSFSLFKRNKKLTSEELDISSINESSICLDCGANVGVVTSKFAEAGATVYAFEPNPYAFEKLKSRFEGNSKIHCINKGVWDKETVFPLYLHEHSDEDELKWSTGSSMLDFKSNIKREKFVEIQTVDLSKFIDSLGQRITLLKMDVEGVEVEIVNSLIDTGVIHRVDQVYVETHDHKIPELKKSTEALRARVKREKLKHVNLNWI